MKNEGIPSGQALTRKSVSTMHTAEMLEKIVMIIRRIGKLLQIDPEEDYYYAGLSSISALELLLELESAFDVAIPDDRFITARTPKTLQKLIFELIQGQDLS